MCRNLKHAVGRRVDDRRAGAHVLGAEFIDDLRPGCHHVPDGRPADPAFELRDGLPRETVRERGERTIEHDAHKLPVTGHRILARRCLRHAAERGAWCAASLSAETRTRAVRNIGDAIQTQRSKRGHAERHGGRDVTEGVAAFVAVRGGVGQLATPDRIHDDE